LTERKLPINPFWYGREVDTLVDRADEVERIVRVAETCGTLFLMGPRRYGKTSILGAAEKELTRRGDMLVLRYDCEAYEDVGKLAAALLSGAVRRYSSALDRAQAIAKKFFLALKPSLSLDPSDGRITVEIGLGPPARRAGVPLLTDVLNGIERLAAEDRRKALVVLDEFQQVVSEGGEKTERQIRAAVQRHKNVAYVFAGSSSRMMTEMIASSARAFWQLGDQLHLGPIPREDFTTFLRKGLSNVADAVSDSALTHLLDVSEDVPYNIQQLASECWTMARDGRCRQVTPETVDEALELVISMQHASYLQRWLVLSLPQKQTLGIVAHSPPGFHLTELARTHGLPRTTMQRALEVLERAHFLRQDFTQPAAIWRFEDPFMRVWLMGLQT